MAAKGTDEWLENHLDEDLVWRRAELMVLRREFSEQYGANANSPATRALSRSLVAMLYAHWEGYTKEAFDCYLTLILRRKPPVSQASTGLLVSHVKHLLRRIEGQDDGAAEELVSLVRGGSQNRLRLKREELIDTGSNLRFDKLRGIYYSFSMSMEDFESKRPIIDIQLCDQRNAVAHGMYSHPDPDSIFDLYDQVFGMIESVRSNIVASLRGKEYRVNYSGDNY